MKVLIVNGSIRDNQSSGVVSDWVEKVSKAHAPDIDWQRIDLKEVGLPLFDEPVSPLFNKDRQPEGAVKVWLDALRDADAYIFVTPEYNHAMGNGLKNAIDFIATEIMRKPFMVVGHGGVGGARAAEQVKLTLNANIGGVPIPNSIAIVGFPGFGQVFDENGDVDEQHKNLPSDLTQGVDELKWHAEALKTKREQ